MNLEPTTIGRYKVLGELGHGAMGKVYLAEDPLLKRSVAIKVVRGWSGIQEDALARFQREAEISAQLNHPNVITIFDVGEEPGFGPFLAMERVEGPSLLELLKEGPLDSEKVMHILIQAACALEAAHAAGIVHRDLKPANLLVDKSGRVKLMDFGIARRQEGTSSGSGLLCTPFYTAPELLKGEMATVTSDRWALAVTAYQCLTNTMPYEGETISGILYAVAHLDPVFSDSLAPEVQAVFRKAMARTPAERHGSLREFIEDLLVHLSLSEEARVRCRTMLDASFALVGTGPGKASIPARRPSKTKRFVRRLLVALGGTALTALLAFLVWDHFRYRKLSVDSQPQGASVFLDGRLVGRTPLKEQRIPSSVRQVKVEKAGFLVLERGLSPEDRQLNFRLEPSPFIVNLASEPEGAEVFLNGVLRGITPMKELQIPGEGIHTLLIRKAGFEPWTMSVSKQDTPPERVQLRAEPKETPKKKPKPKPGFWKRILSGKNPITG